MHTHLIKRIHAFRQAIDNNTQTVAPAQWLRVLCLSSRYRWLRHLLFISLYLFANLSEIFHLPADMEGHIPFRDAVRLYHLINMMTGLLFVYINIWILVPFLLYRGKYVQYFLALLGLLLAFFFICFWMDRHIILPVSLPQYADRHLRLTADEIISCLTLPLILMSGTTGAKIFSSWMYKMDRINNLENLQLKYELSQLKNMVNPHFLFNTLNNLQLLIHTDTRRANELLQGLSDILHYQVYESAADKVFLDREIRFFRHLLTLESCRREQWDFDIKVWGDARGIRVYPHLFIPFIENAVKHGAQGGGETAVHILFDIREKELFFRCENALPAHPPVLPPVVGGAGLQYAKRRLELLFGNNYNLHIEQGTSQFTVQLNIPL